MELKTKYNIGDRIWTVHKYPIGARVFEGKVHKINVFVTKYGQRSTYRIEPFTYLEFPEPSVYGTKEEAEQVRQDWINKVNKADDDD